MQQFLLFATICKVTRVQVFFIAFVIRLCIPIRVLVITLVLKCKIQYVLTFAPFPWWCANTTCINTSEYSWLQLTWKMSGVRCAAVQDCDDDDNIFWICRLEIWTLISGKKKFSIQHFDPGVRGQLKKSPSNFGSSDTNQDSCVNFKFVACLHYFGPTSPLSFAL